MIPRRLRCFPDDERFAHLPWYWHLSGPLAQRLAKVPGLRRWWGWWVDRWGQAIQEAHETDRLRDAIREILRAADALFYASRGDGHPGTEHDQLLYFGGAYDTVGDCALCGGAQYGAEDALVTAYARARALLGMPRQWWEAEWRLSEEPEP